MVDVRHTPQCRNQIKELTNKSFSLGFIKKNETKPIIDLISWLVKFGWSVYKLSYAAISVSVKCETALLPLLLF